MTQHKNQSLFCSPPNVAIIGGGRWARVLAKALSDVVSDSVNVSVHTFHNEPGMSAWVSENGLEKRIRVYSTWPSPNTGAIIVCNAARDHEEAVNWALIRGIPTLVEKPITLSASATDRLAKLALERQTPLAAAHVFLFASYLQQFSQLAKEIGAVESLAMDWVDPISESRYGEKKQYDAGVAIFEDLLPHILCITGLLIPNSTLRCRELKFDRGGASLSLKIMHNNIPCDIKLQRNGASRVRNLNAKFKAGNACLNFSSEPGTIDWNSTVISGDLNWPNCMKPVASMLSAFLKFAAGGEQDRRLDFQIGLRANQVIDQVAPIYFSAKSAWLNSSLDPSGIHNLDVKYALFENSQRT